MIHCKWLPLSLFLTGLILAQNVFSHPYHSPLTFIKHQRDGAGYVFTNIPKKCFKDGRLVCHDYYFLSPKRSNPTPSERKMDVQVQP